MAKPLIRFVNYWQIVWDVGMNLVIWIWNTRTRTHTILQICACTHVNDLSAECCENGPIIQKYATEGDTIML